MKLIAYSIVSTLAVPLVTLISTGVPLRTDSIGLVHASMAETRLLLAEAPSTTASTETPQVSHPERASNTTASNAVEARIKELHAELKLTQAQEELWSKVTQVMRDNEKAMEALHKTRSERMKTMTAVQDVKSYAEIAEAHADGLKKFVPVFEALYNSMSDEQKKNADTLFSRDPMAEKNTPAKRRGKP